VLATGSIRNLVNFKSIAKIEIVDPDEYKKLKQEVIHNINKIGSLKAQIKKENEITFKNIGRVIGG
jgi:hypothetical protein